MRWRHISRWPVICHIRYWWAIYRINRWYDHWASLGMNAMNARDDYDHALKIWRGEM